MVAWVIGFGAIWVLGPRGPSLWALALASAIPLLVHLLVTFAAWVGLLGSQLPLYFSLQEVWHRISQSIMAGYAAWPGWQRIPLQFSGIEDMHGNLGYAAGQAGVLFSVLALTDWREGRIKHFTFALICIGSCLVSLFIASSRGGILYLLLVLMLATVLFKFKFTTDRGDAGTAARDRRRIALAWGLALAVTAAVGMVAWRVVSTDIRWQTMTDKIMLGMQVKEPLRVLCEGLTAEEKQAIRIRYSQWGEQYVEQLIRGLEEQDGGRILLMRAGLKLVAEHPWGLDGGRSSYQKVILQQCGHPPALAFAHLHQSWLDLALGLGWGGAILFASVLLCFLRAGWQAAGQGATGVLGYALALLSLFWFLRGFADSLYREHYLQMQALLLSYCYGGVWFGNKNSV